MLGDHSGSPQLDSNPFEGLDATGLTIRDSNGVFQDPSNLVFKTTDTIRLAMRWEIRGSNTAAWVASPLAFRVTYFAEQLGGRNDVTLATHDDHTELGVFIYDDSKTGASTNVGAPLNNVPGTYKVTAVLNFIPGSERNPGIPVPPPFAAFIEGPVIQVFV